MKKNIFISLLISAIISLACVCGGGAPTPTNTIPDNRTYIEFPTNTGLVVANQYYTSGCLTGYSNFGLANKMLTADGSIQFRYLDANSQDAIIGFNTSATSQGYNNYEVYAWVTASNQLYIGGASDAISLRGTVSAGTYVRISRIGSTFKLQTSANDTTYSDVFTYTYTSSATMYICANVGNSKRLTYCSGIGLSNYTGGSGIGRQLDTLIICDGNSLTAQGYPLILNGLLASTSSVIQYGVGGQTTTQMASDVSAQIDVLYKTGRKNILIAWEVGNDIFVGGTAYDAYIRYANYCNARRAIGWHVIAVTCPPRTNVNDDTLQVANSYLLANYTSFADEILDTRSDSRLATITATYWDADNVHLNATGYTVLANLLKTKIEN